MQKYRYTHQTNVFSILNKRNWKYVETFPFFPYYLMQNIYIYKGKIRN